MIFKKRKKKKKTNLFSSMSPYWRVGTMLIMLKSNVQFLNSYDASIIIILMLQQDKIILREVTMASSYK